MSARARRALAALALAALVSGCGDPVLWARWSAERDLWHAMREADRLGLRPRAATPADYARAERAFQAIVTRYPAARWARRDGGPMEREVATVSANAELMLARLAELQGRGDEALEGYARLGRDWSALPAVTLTASVRRAEALERLGRPAAAAAAWERVLRESPALGPEGGPAEARLEALRRLAAWLTAEKRASARESLLADAEARFSAAAEPPGTPRATIALLDAVAECRALRGDEAGAIAAGRRVLTAGVPLEPEERARRTTTLGERHLSAGRPDSALSYSRAAQRDAAGPFRIEALDLEARAFAALGEPDSALAVYGTIVAEFGGQPAAVAEARYARALLLESRGRWTLARTEYSALCAAYPAHPRALEAWARVVRHHRRAGEVELARIESEHALGAIDQMASMQHEAGERRRMLEGRVAVLLAAARPEEAARELQTLWSSAGMSVAGARLGSEAAEAIERASGDRALARRLWQILARSSPDDELRRRAAAELESRPS